MGDPQKLIKRSKTRMPKMTSDERVEGARGFVMVTSTAPLPPNATAYRLMVSEDAVINVYHERKQEGGGSDDMLTKRNLGGVTLKTLLYITPPRHNPSSKLELASGSVVAYLEDTDVG